MSSVEVEFIEVTEEKRCANTQIDVGSIPKGPDDVDTDDTGYERGDKARRATEGAMRVPVNLEELERMIQRCMDAVGA